MDAKLYSWFLGPKAENAALLEDLVLEAVRDCVFWRRNFHPEDESLIPEKLRHHEGFQDAVATLRQEFWELLAGLKRDVPFYSPRYIGHMLGDQLLPAILGYFAAMLHNPNNVSPEAAPITTLHELSIASQMGALMGHITSGGTVANFEAMWVARNLKYAPLAAWEAARSLSLEGITYEAADGAVRGLVEEDDVWALLNLSPSAALALHNELFAACRAQRPEASPRELLSPFTLSSLGIQSFFGQPALREIPPGVIMVPATAHYSLGKGAEALGIGQRQLCCVPVDGAFRMDVDALAAQLERCLESRTPVIAVVSVMGNTEEGAVDPLHRVVALREALAPRGLQFSLHCDAAWGGYVRSLFYDEQDRPVKRADDLARIVRSWPREDVFASFQATGHADSATIDPHKLGYIPYPCGVITFKDSRVKELIAFEAPYIGSQMDGDGGDGLPNLGHYIFEGSKPGAAAASAWLAHRVVPLNHAGYGMLIGKSIEGTQELYLKCRDVLKPDLVAKGAILHLLTDPPDLNLLCFAINLPEQPSLAVMTSQPSLLSMVSAERRMVRLSSISKTLRPLRSVEPVSPLSVLQRHRFMISKTSFVAKHYGMATAAGPHSLRHHLDALGIADDELSAVGAMTVLRCTVLDPWLALSRGHRTDYVVDFVDCLREAILNALPRTDAKGRSDA